MSHSMTQNKTVDILSCWISFRSEHRHDTKTRGRAIEHQIQEAVGLEVIVSSCNNKISEFPYHSSPSMTAFASQNPSPGQIM